MCACRILSLRRRVAFLSQPVTCCPLAPSFSIRALYVIFYSKPHPTPHVPLLASWRSLSCSSKCDALLEIIHIIRCKSFVCCQVVSCVFSQQQIDRGHVYIEYPKSAKGAAIEYTQEEVLRVKCFIFPGIFFLCVQTNAMVIASGCDNNVSLRHSPWQFPEGTCTATCANS